MILPRTVRWIAGFQTAMGRPTAKVIADFARIPVLTIQQYTYELSAARSRAAQKKGQVQDVEKYMLAVEAQAPMLTMVLGPFGYEYDLRYSYWQALKVAAGDIAIASVLCRLDNQGNGGFILLRLWYKQEEDYQQHGDPEGLRLLPPNIVIRTICDHLATEYNVGFVENANQAIDRVGIQKGSATLLKDQDEVLARAIAEEQARARHPR